MDFDEDFEKSKNTESLPWSQVWQEAVLRPSVETFEYLLGDPQASSGRAFTWVAAASAIAAVFQAVIGAFFQAVFDTQSFWLNFNTTTNNTTTTTEFGAGETLLFGLFCGVPLAAIFAVIGLAIWGAILNFIARLLGGTGEYNDTVYAMATYTAPIAIINGVIGSIPIVGLLSFILALYSFGLQVIAIKSVHRFGWGQAILTVFMPFIVICGLAVCCIVALVGVAGS